VFRFPESRLVRRMGGRGGSGRLTNQSHALSAFGRRYRACLDLMHNELTHFGPHLWIELQFCMGAF
jgi:hypothetical protein